MEYYKVYQDLKSAESKEIDSEISLEVPNLKGVSNWRTFRDSILMKLSLTKGKPNYPMEYV